MRIPKPVLADLALVGVTIVWGSSFTIVKQSLSQVSPLLFIALRFSIAFAVVLACMPGAALRIGVDTLRRGTVLGLFLLAGFVFQTLGLGHTSPSRSAFITSLAVLLVPVLGFFLFGRRPRAQTLVGVLVATVGLGLLTLDRFELRLNVGDALTLLCAIAFALHILYIGRYAPETDFRQLVLIQLGVTTAVVGLLTPFLETPFLVWDVRLVFYLAITGVLGTALGFYVQNRAQQFTTANRTALIFALEPLFAALFAYALLGQTLAGLEWAGAILVMAGVITSELRRD
jgi:drug/metabolite transporter (DMT)-like permease